MALYITTRKFGEKHLRQLTLGIIFPRKKNAVYISVNNWLTSERMIARKIGTKSYVLTNMFWGDYLLLYLSSTRGGN